MNKVLLARTVKANVLPIGMEIQILPQGGGLNILHRVKKNGKFRSVAPMTITLRDEEIQYI